jgi:predicted outer membrane protein
MRVVRPKLWGRRVWGAVAASAALILLAPDAASAEPGVPVPPSELITDKGAGAVTAADKDLVIKVRLAGLWEIPAGEMAQDRSTDERIQKIGRDIAEQHAELDDFARDAAEKLDIELPDKPNSDQQGWLDEMRDAEGDDFDRIYIDRLRAAHGKIFPAIATVRASTRNDTVRKLAQRANQFVATHLTLLETSGLVDFKALPTAPAPNANTSAPAATQVENVAEQSNLATTNLPVLLVVLVAGLAAGGFATSRLMGPRRRPSRRRW